MYTDKDLENEIREVVAELYDTKQIDPNWITIAVIKRHIESFEKFTDFSTNAIWAHTRRISGQVLRRLKPPPVTPQVSGILAGFEHLQSHYEVERQQGSNVAKVRVERDALTTKERRAIASYLHSNGAAWIRHGDELDRETDALIAAGVLDDDSEE